MASKTALTEEASMSDRSFSSPSGPSASKGTTTSQKLRRHLKRFWWAYLLAFVIVVLIVVLCVIYVAFPRMAQDAVSDSTLNITSIVLSDPSPNSVHIVQDSVIQSTSQYHPTLDAFDASLSLAGAAAPYASILLPSVQSDAHVPVHVEQDLNITDAGAFADYTSALLANSSIVQRISGQTWLHQGSLPAVQVSYDKDVTLAGFAGLAGFAVTQFAISPLPASDGSNMNGTLAIPNPTVLTVSMGNVTLGNSVDGSPIGNVTLENLVLKPGNNSVPMRGIADQTAVLGLIAGKYKDGKLPVDISGATVMYNGQRLPYFEAALNATKQRVVLDVGAALRAIGLNLGASSGS